MYFNGFIKNTYSIFVITNNNIFTMTGFGKLDKNTFKHFILGTILHAACTGLNYISTNDLIIASIQALLPTIVAALVWEYQQHKLKKALFDWWDIFFSCLFGIVVTIILILIK